MKDLLGMLLEEAEETLKSEGKGFEILLTAPPNKEQPEGFLRVIRHCEIKGIHYLTACRIEDTYR